MWRLSSKAVGRILLFFAQADYIGSGIRYVCWTRLVGSAALYDTDDWCVLYTLIHCQEVDIDPLELPPSCILHLLPDGGHNSRTDTLCLGSLTSNTTLSRSRNRTTNNVLFKHLTVASLILLFQPALA